MDGIDAETVTPGIGGFTGKRFKLPAVLICDQIAEGNINLAQYLLYTKIWS